MHRAGYVTSVIAIWAMLGCASTPRTGEPVAVAESHSVEKTPSVAVVQNASAPIRLPSPDESQSSITAGNSICQASHADEILPEGDAEIGSAMALSDLIATAIANNPDIQVARLHARSLSARVPQVGTLDDPMLMTTTFLEPLQTAAGPQGVILNISQKIPWFGKRQLRACVASRDAQSAFARVASAELSVVEQVKLAYYELYFLNQAIEVNDDLETRIKDVIEITKRKYETASERTGLETVLQTQIELSRLQTKLVELEQNKVKANAKLAKAMNLAEGLVLDVEPSIEDSDVPRTAELLVALIDHCQPELRALQRERSREQAAIALARKNYYPDVTVGFNWHEIGSTGLSAVANGRDAYSVGAGVNLPIYRQKLDAGLREAQLKAGRVTRQIEATWNEVRFEVQTLHAEAVEHDRVAQILNDDILPKSKETLDLSMEAYRVDRITFQQLIENYKMLLRARIDYDRRRSHREQALAKLERAVGCAIATWPVEFEEVQGVLSNNENP